MAAAKQGGQRPKSPKRRAAENRAKSRIKDSAKTALTGGKAGLDKLARAARLPASTASGAGG